MKISALDAVWYNLPFNARLRRISELGYEGVEFWLTAAELGFEVTLQWPSSHKVDRLALSERDMTKMLEENDLKAVALGQYCLLGEFPHPFEPTEVDFGRRKTRRIEDIKALMDYAVGIGTKVVITETGGHAEKPEQWTPLLEIVFDLVEYAEKIGAILAIENAPHFLVNDVDDLLRLMNEIDSKALRINFDPANLNLAPPGVWDIPEAIKKLRNYICLVHTKDSVYGGSRWGKQPDGTWDIRPVGRGKVPWKECLSALEEIGYKGHLIMEYEEAPKGEAERSMIEGKKYLEGLLTKTSL